MNIIKKLFGLSVDEFIEYLLLLTVLICMTLGFFSIAVAALEVIGVVGK